MHLHIVAHGVHFTRPANSQTVYRGSEVMHDKMSVMRNVKTIVLLQPHKLQVSFATLRPTTLSIIQLIPFVHNAFSWLVDVVHCGLVHPFLCCA